MAGSKSRSTIEKPSIFFVIRLLLPMDIDMACHKKRKKENCNGNFMKFRIRLLNFSQKGESQSVCLMI